MNRFATAVLLSSLLATIFSAAGKAQTVNFDDITTPPAGQVGPSRPAYTQFGFTTLRIPDPDDPATFGNHFHPIAGNGTPGFPNTTAALFPSDDGSPIRYYFGDYTGNNKNNYDVGTQKPFDLLRFDILELEGSFLLTSSTGATLAIDHTGLYDVSGIAGFQNILEFRHDYTGNGDGGMILDDIAFRPALAAVPEPGTLAVLVSGLAAGGLLLHRRRK